MLELGAWFRPMMKEIETIRAKGVYKLVNWSVGRNIIDLKWVFTLKFDKVSLLYKRKIQVVV